MAPRILWGCVISLTLLCSTVSTVYATEKDETTKAEAKERAATAIEAYRQAKDPVEQAQLLQEIEYETQVVAGGGNDESEKPPA